MTAPAVARGWASVQAFRSIRAATRGLIAAPWTPASLSLFAQSEGTAVERGARRGAVVPLFFRKES
jgi:hypothetical protein